MSITLVEGLSLDADGTLINALNDAVHLRQGDMDGACGPYCVAMALLALGMIARHDVQALNGIDYRTRAGRLLREIVHFQDPLVLQGTSVTQLEKMLSAYNATVTSYQTGRPGEVLDKTRAAVMDGYPVILDVNSRGDEGLCHWTLAIGACDRFIYLLDPGYPLQSASYWNAAVSTEASSTRFGYRYMNSYASCDIEVDQMLVVMPCDK